MHTASTSFGHTFCVKKTWFCRMTFTFKANQLLFYKHYFNRYLKCQTLRQKGTRVHVHMQLTTFTHVRFAERTFCGVTMRAKLYSNCACRCLYILNIINIRHLANKSANLHIIYTVTAIHIWKKNV